MQIIPETRQLFVSATGAMFDAGGIEVVDLDSLRSRGLAIRETDGATGADLGPFKMVSPDRGFLSTTTDFLPSSHLHRFSVAGGVVPDELAVAVDYLAPAIEFDPSSNSLFFPIGREPEYGLHVFDAVTGQRLTTNVIPTSGRPTDLVLVPEPETMALFSTAVLLMLGNKFRTTRRRPFLGCG